MERSNMFTCTFSEFILAYVRVYRQAQDYAVGGRGGRKGVGGGVLNGVKL